MNLILIELKSVTTKVFICTIHGLKPVNHVVNLRSHPCTLFYGGPITRHMLKQQAGQRAEIG